MASALRAQLDAFKRVAGADTKTFADRGRNLGMSPRQANLNNLWTYYTCTQYEGRQVDWDGSRRADPLSREMISHQGFIPPGFDAGPQMSELPIKYRRPSAPYHLVKVIVDRFTGLLFSERRHPQLRVEGDDATEDFAHALSEASRLWPAMILARTYGGATGTAVVGFQFVNGKPIVEVHDPRWVIPTFRDRQSLELEGFEVRYQYPTEVRDPETGLWHQLMLWYRRVVDSQSDVVFKPAPVGDGQEPAWEESYRVDHSLGFCPGQWIQNIPVLDDVDGEPDCHGILDLVEAIDALLSMAHRGVVFNCDPSVVLTTDMELASVKKGSLHAIKLEKGAGASYMEISGAGPQAARELAKELRAYALEVAQCVLEHPDVAGRTATEVERVYSSMLSKADVLREQYGERGVKPLMEKMVMAARKMGTPTVDAEGNIVRHSLLLPPKMKDGVKVERKLGPGGVQTLQWPGYFEPSLLDAQQATQAAAQAKVGGLIDDEHAVGFVAEYFRVDDVPAMRERIAAEQAAARGEEDYGAYAAMADAQKAQEAQVSGGPTEGVKFFQYEIEGGIVTINEVRASKGLPPLAEDGDLTLPEYRAKHAAVFAASTLAQSPDAAERITGVSGGANSVIAAATATFDKGE